MCLIGSGIGLQFNPMIRNIWLYYPDSKGFISIVFILFYGLSTVLFSLLIEYMFSLYYSFGEEENSSLKRLSIFSDFYQLTLLIIFLFAAVGFLLMSNHVPEKLEEQDESKQGAENLLLRDRSINDDNMSMSNYKEMEYTNEESFQSTFWSRFINMLASGRFWCITLMFFFSFCFSFLLTHSVRFLGNYYWFNSHIIFLSAVFHPAVITIAKIIISLLYDLIRFKIIFSFIVIIQIALGIIIPFINNDSVFLSVVCISGFCYAGNSSLLSPLISKIFGVEHSFELSGIAIALSSLSVFTVPLISLAFSNSIEVELFIQCLFFGSAGTSLIALILCLSFNDSPFDYSNEQNSLAKELKPTPSSKELNQQWFANDVKSERNSNC